MYHRPPPRTFPVVPAAGIMIDPSSAGAQPQAPAAVIAYRNDLGSAATVWPSGCERGSNASPVSVP